MRDGRWPYTLALVMSVLFTFGFLYAPFSGIAYLALPAVAFGTFWAWRQHSPARFGLAVSTSLFIVGLTIGMIALGVSAAAVDSGDFFAREWGFAIIAAVLWILPPIALLLGIGSAALALRRPGSAPVRVVREAA